MSKPMNITREIRVEISIQGKRDAVGIGKDVIRLLGSPSHVSLKVNEDGSKMVIAPCDADDVMSFKTPDKLFSDHRCVFRITSKSFVHDIMTCNNMERELSYTIPGMYSEKQNVACFDFRQNFLSILRKGRVGEQEN